MIRHRLDVLYPTTVAVRVFFLIVIAALYGETRDRLFIAIFVVVALGVVLTTVALLMDHLRATA
jgi:hypothetical protein